MKKYLLSFLLITVSTIGDGWAGCTESAHTQWGADKKAFIQLDAIVPSSNSSDNPYRYTYACDAGDGSECGDNNKLLVWGGYTRGAGDCTGSGDRPSFCTGITVYECQESGDIWNPIVTKMSQIADCDNGWASSARKGTFTKNGQPVDKTSSNAFYDLYVRDVYDTFSNSNGNVRAYQFDVELNDAVCKKKIEKKCGRNPYATASHVALFCPENDRVNVYQSNNGTWKDRTTEVVLHPCKNPPSGDSWQDWGGWNESLHVFFDSSKLDGSKEKGQGFINTFEDKKSVNDTRFCTWCEDVNKEPVLNEVTNVYECKDAEPADPEIEPEPVEPPKICGVPCDGKKTIYCPNIPMANDSSVFYCPESGQDWQEIDAQAWCCNKKCTPPKTDLTDVGIWKVETRHHLYVRRGPISNDGAYNFYSEIKDDTAYGYNIEENCTACPTGTTYSKTTQKCK